MIPTIFRDYRRSRTAVEDIRKYVGLERGKAIHVPECTGGIHVHFVYCSFTFVAWRAYREWGGCAGVESRWHPGGFCR